MTCKPHPPQPAHGCGGTGPVAGARYNQYPAAPVAAHQIYDLLCNTPVPVPVKLMIPEVGCVVIHRVQTAVITLDQPVKSGSITASGPRCITVCSCRPSILSAPERILRAAMVLSALISLRACIKRPGMPLVSWNTCRAAGGPKFRTGIIYASRLRMGVAMCCLPHFIRVKTVQISCI
jgi:hypothetical protein